MTNNHPDGRDGNAVPLGCECPSCGEDDADRLVWIDDKGVRSSWDTEPISASRNCSVSARVRASAMVRARPSRSSDRPASAIRATTRGS